MKRFWKMLLRVLGWHSPPDVDFAKYITPTPLGELVTLMQRSFHRKLIDNCMRTNALVRWILGPSAVTQRDDMLDALLEWEYKHGAW